MGDQSAFPAGLSLLQQSRLRVRADSAVQFWASLAARFVEWASAWNAASRLMGDSTAAVVKFCAKKAWRSYQMNDRPFSFDVVVVGAGPAGLAAACAATESGARVGVVDETPWLGGQIWRGQQSQPVTPQAHRWFDRR